MADRIPYELNTATIAPGGIQRFSKSAKFLALFDATDAASVQVSFHGMAFFSLPLGIQLQNLDALGVLEFWIKNVSGAPNTVRIATGWAEFRDQRFAVGPAPAIPVAPSTYVGASGRGVFVSLIDAVILPANAARRGGSIYNLGAGTLYVGLGATAVTPADFTVAVAPGDFYELPAGFGGMVRGIFGAAGTALAQELS